MLKNEADSLFYGREFDLHTLNQAHIRDQRRDLTELHQFLVSNDDHKGEEMKQLQQICIDCKINSPLLGDQLYDPNAFDLSKKKRPFGDKIKQLCQENNVFWDYKKNSRLALDLTTTDKASVDLKKRKEFLKVRG